jgi:hypothetical protein
LAGLQTEERGQEDRRVSPGAAGATAYSPPLIGRRDGPLPTTPTVKSGTGGEHRHFRLPPGVTVNSKKIADGIDAKGSGFVIAPPSKHTRGIRYEWVTPPDTPLADAPDWLLAMAAAMPSPDGRGLATSTRNVSESDGGFIMGSADMGSTEPCDFASHP